MNRKKLAQQIRELLKTEIPVMAQRIEGYLNAEMPFPRMTTRQVLYVRIPGSGTAKGQRRHVTPRAAQVLAYLQKKKKATAAELQKHLGINRNVVSGAIFELRRKRLVRSERQSA